MKRNGYIALMASVIISLVLAGIAVEVASSGFYARMNIVGGERAEEARTLAQGCAQQAVALLITDPTYTGNATSTFGDGTCYIFPIMFDTPSPEHVTIKVQAKVQDTYSNIVEVWDISDIHFGEPTNAAPHTTRLTVTRISQQEVSTLP
jgi:hypothetical protein